MGGRKKLHLMQYLSKGIGQCHGKEEVCVGTPSVDPEVPENRAEGRGEKEHHQYHQGVAKVYTQGREKEEREKVTLKT